jgi:hypothetical protein
MFRLTWPSSGVYDILLFIPEGICFAVFVAFVACYIMHRQKNARPSTIKLHADGNLTSKVIELRTLV